MLRFCDLALAALGEAREEIDALNVYPVPDGDTGTNMFLTFEAARDAMLDAIGDADRRGPGDLRTALAAFARGALLGARGNSGVIMSAAGRRASAGGSAAAGPERPLRHGLRRGLALATEAGYAAVGAAGRGHHPLGRPGRLRRGAAVGRRRLGAAPAGCVRARRGRGARGAGAHARAAAGRCAQAGVVDAGGRGLCVVLDAAETARDRRRPVSGQPPLGTRRIPVPLPAGDLTADGPGVRGDVPARRRRRPRSPRCAAALAGLGDSLVVVGGDGLWNVHVHVDDVGAADRGGHRGRPPAPGPGHPLRRAGRARRARRPPARRPAPVVAVAAGAGLGELFVAGRRDRRARAGPGRRPSTGQMLEAIDRRRRRRGRSCCPTTATSIAAAEAAARTAREDERHPGRGDPDPTPRCRGWPRSPCTSRAAPSTQDIVEMTAAARHARSGAVTVAASQAMTMAGPCEPGDVLGRRSRATSWSSAHDLFDGGHRTSSSGCSAAVASWSRWSPVPTPATSRERCARAPVATPHPTVDVVVYDGGQPRYPLLVGVE